MTIIGDAFIRVRPDSTGFGPETEKGVLGQVGSIAKKAAGLLAGAFVVHEGVDFLKSSVDAARESNKVEAQTAAAIKSTGAAAKVSAEQIGQLATAISNKTGIDDEAIAKGENLLLTFCLEDTAEALTRDRGWVRHDGLRAGDLILGYDPETDLIEWQPIESMHRFDVEGDLIRWRSKQIDVATTPHHRWWTVARSGRSYYQPQFRTTEQISGQQVYVKIGGGTPDAFAGEARYSDDLIELAAWVFTEGWFVPWKSQRGRRTPKPRFCPCGVQARNARGVPRCDGCAQHPVHTTNVPPLTAETAQHHSVGFCQSETANPLLVKRIRSMVERLRMAGHRITETSYTARYNGSTMVEWHFAYDLGRTIREMLPGKKLTADLLTTMTVHQAQTFMATLIDADGHVDRHGHEHFIQKDPDALAMVAMLAAMLGRRSTVLGRGGDADALYFPETDRLKGSGVNARPEHYKGVVWCPHLRTGIFMARNRGRTFWTGNTNVRNEVGKGNDVFNQASRTLVDMGAALGGDASSSAIQLGKALNDPVQGLTALRRVGVQFTDAQEKQIKTMQESGNILGAQKVILAELNKEFGGSAAAQATAADRLRVTFDNIKEDIGNKLIPIIDQVATFVADRLPGALDAMGAVFGRVADALGPVVRAIGDGIRALFDGLRGAEGPANGFLGAMNKIGSVLRGVLQTVRDFVHGFTEGIDRLSDPQSKAAAIGAQLALVYNEKVRPALEKVVGFIQDHFRPVLLGLGAILAVAAGPVVAVVAAFTLLYTRFAGVRAVVNGTQAALAGFVKFLAEDVLPVVFKVAEVFAHAFDSVVGSITKRLAPLAEAIGHILKVIEVAVAVALAPIILAWRLFGDEILAVVKGAFTAIAAIVKGALRIVGDVIDAVLAVINGDWGKAWDAIRDIPAAALSTLGKVLEAQLRAALAVLTGLGKLVGSAFSSIFSGVGRVVGDAVEGAIGVVKGLPGRFASALSGLAGIVLRAIGALPAIVVKALEGLAAAGAGVLLQMFLDWREIFAKGVDAVTGFVQTVLGLPGRILSALSTMPGEVADAFVAVWEGAQRVVADAVEGIVSTLAALPGRVAGALGTFAEAVVQVVSNLPGQIVGGLASLGTVVGDLFTRAVQGWGGLIRAGIDQAVGFFTELPGRVLAALSALPGVIATSFSLAWKGAQDVVRTAIDGVVGIVTGLPGRLASVLGQLADIGLKLGEGLVGGILRAVGGMAGAAADFAVSFGKAIIDYVNRNVIDRINSVLEFTIESPFPPHARFTVNPPDIPRIPVPKLAGGGLVPATPGGILATIGEGSRPEAVLPLPPGLVEGLQAIASGRGQGALIAGNLVVQGATANAAYVTGVEVVRQLAAEVFRATGGRIA